MLEYNILDQKFQNKLFKFDRANIIRTKDVITKNFRTQKLLEQRWTIKVSKTNLISLFHAGELKTP